MISEEIKDYVKSVENNRLLNLKGTYCERINKICEEGICSCCEPYIRRNET